MITTLLGKKVGMTRVYDAQNVLVPVTVVEAGPCPVVQVKTTDSDGYNAVQIAYGEKREKLLSRAEVGHLKKHGIAEKCYAHLAEVRLSGAPGVKSGDVVTVANFAEGSFVDVIGTSKGRGFQGVIKRHGMAGGPAAHGSMFHRRVGSIGMRMTPGRTLPGQRMPGHLGNKQRTVQNLQVVKVLPEKNVLLIRGGIPGANGSSVLIRAAIKKSSAGK
jgi:large subunit ribosomal protein L3